MEENIFLHLGFYEVPAIPLSMATLHYIVCNLCRCINCFCIEVGILLFHAHLV